MSAELIELSNALAQTTEHAAGVRGGDSHRGARFVQRRHLA